MRVAVLAHMPDVSRGVALGRYRRSAEWLKTAQIFPAGEQNVTQGTLNSLS